MITFPQLILVVVICQLISIARQVYLRRYIDSALSRDQWLKNKQYRALQRIERESSADSAILWGVEVSDNGNRIYALRGGEYQEHRYEGWDTDEHFDRVFDNMQARKQMYYNVNIETVDQDSMLYRMMKSESLKYSKLKYIAIWRQPESLWNKLFQRTPAEKGFYFISINTTQEDNKMHSLKEMYVFTSEINDLKKTINRRYDE